MFRMFLLSQLLLEVPLPKIQTQRGGEKKTIKSIYGNDINCPQIQESAAPSPFKEPLQ